MRFLVGWDEPSEAELISLYLNVDGIEAILADNSEHLLQLAGDGTQWDAVLLTTDTPDPATAFALFKKVQQTSPNCPIVGACSADAVLSVAHFMTNGLRTYVIRDAAGDFMFLLRATLESTVEAVRAERERLVSEKLREEIESVRRLQESIIPSTLHSPDGYDICARYESSQIRVMGGHPVTLAGGDYYEQLEAESEELTKALAREEINLTLSGPYDDRPAIVTIHAGAGGTDAQDWAEMLVQMYSLWAESGKRPLEVMDLSYGEEAGLRGATLEIGGPHAFGYLIAEQGVHRLVRLSPFDPNNLRDRKSVV